MKIKLTEQQIGGLVSNLKGDDLSNIDMEKEAPNLSKLVKFLMTNKNLETDNLSKISSKPKMGLFSRKDKDDVVSGRNFAKNIPSGNMMMHPLGHTQPITSPFGSRDTGIAGATKNHKGVDISTPSNSPVYAPLDGTVLDSRDTTPNACGGFVKLDHANVETKFCHLSRMIVQQGEKVKKGQIIGYSGGGRSDPHPGISSGPHLHYEILNKSGVAVNPISVEPNLTA
jgi:murein DD-endopeptidase MepM/ murein hydrolase activator NlpD